MAVISMPPVVPPPVETIGSSPAGSEMPTDTSVPPARGCKLVVAALVAAVLVAASPVVDLSSPHPAANTAKRTATYANFILRNIKPPLLFVGGLPCGPCAVALGTPQANLGVC